MYPALCSDRILYCTRCGFWPSASPSPTLVMGCPASARMISAYSASRSILGLLFFDECGNRDLSHAGHFESRQSGPAITDDDAKAFVLHVGISLTLPV